MSSHVAVLMGGWSAEREVSMVSGAAVANALSNAGYKVTSIDFQRDISSLLAHLYPRPDAVFNALHGRYGEDGSVQGLLNILDIPYTHSGVLASAMAMDKPMAKRLMKDVGIQVASHQIVTQEEMRNSGVMDAPYVVKPLKEGSSVGVSIVHEGEHFDPAAAEWHYGEQVMVEKYIMGRELTVAVMGDRALGVTEIDTEHRFYDYNAKYDRGESRHQVPADLPEDVYDEALRISLLAHETIGCRGVSRADMRYDGANLYMLEVNTQPGMTPTSLVPEQAAHVNISFEELVSWMVEHAACDG